MIILGHWNRYIPFPVDFRFTRVYLGRNLCINSDFTYMREILTGLRVYYIVRDRWTDLPDDRCRRTYCPIRIIGTIYILYPYNFLPPNDNDVLQSDKSTWPIMTKKTTTTIRSSEEIMEKNYDRCTNPRIYIHNHIRLTTRSFPINRKRTHQRTI